MTDDLAEIRATYQAARTTIGQFAIGLEDLFEQLTIAWILDGHCLLAGAPGSGQFRLVETSAHLFGLSLRRISFAPDGTADQLLDAVFAQESRLRDSSEGPEVSCPNVLFGEEIHRGSPFAQCVLLDSIVNGSLVHRGRRFPTVVPFFFIASEGSEENEQPTLSQLQIDRFLFRLAFKSPRPEHELRIAMSNLDVRCGLAEPGNPALASRKSLSAETLRCWRQQTERIQILPEVARFAVRLVRGTRVHEGEHSDLAYEWIRHGAGPRASNVLTQAARVRAMLYGREVCSFEDVRVLTHAVLRHRIALNKNARSSGVEADNVVDRLLYETAEVDD